MRWTSIWQSRRTETFAPRGQHAKAGYSRIQLSGSRRNRNAETRETENSNEQVEEKKKKRRKGKEKSMAGEGSLIYICLSDEVFIRPSTPTLLFSLLILLLLLAPVSAMHL